MFFGGYYYFSILIMLRLPRRCITRLLERLVYVIISSEMVFITIVLEFRLRRIDVAGAVAATITIFLFSKFCVAIRDRCLLFANEVFINLFFPLHVARVAAYEKMKKNYLFG